MRYGGMRSALPLKRMSREYTLRFFSAALDRSMLHCVPQAPQNALLRGVRPFQARMRLPILPTTPHFTKVFGALPQYATPQLTTAQHAAPQENAMQLPAHELPAFIEQCLQQGFKAVEIADALGCTEGYISQLISASPRLQEAKAGLDSRYADIDTLYDRIEQRALEELEKRMAVCTKPMELVRIAQAMNAAKRRSAAPLGALEGGAGKGATVNITIPQQVAVQQFQFNGNNQAIALASEDGVQERALITASTQQLNTLAAAVVRAQAEQTNQIVATQSIDDM